MGESLTALFLQNPELANAIRRRQEGAAIMQGGMDSSPIRSPWQGLSRLAQALVGGYEQGQADKDIKEVGAKRSALVASLMRDDTAPEMPQVPSVPAPQLPRASMDRPAGGASVPANLSDDDLLVRTAWGESRGETPLGQQAVAAVIRNRARAAGQSVRDVVLAPGQFEPWGNPQTREQMLKLDPNSPEYQAIAQSVLGTQNDPTGGATHFYSPKAQEALGRPAPAWAAGQGMDIGNHRFYNLPYGGGRGAAPQGGETIPAQMPPQGGAPQAPPQDDLIRRAEVAQRKAMQAAAIGENHLAQQFQNQAVTYRQMALQKPQTEMVVVATPGTQTGYSYVPRNQAAGMAAPEPRPMVSVENKGEGTWEASRAKDYADRVKVWEDAGIKSTQTLSRLTRMEAMLDNITTGAGAQTSITAGQLAQRLGVPEATMSALGIDPKTVASGEAIRSLSSQMLVGMMGAGGFPTNNFSDADRAMLERALPGLQNSPQGNKLIIQIMRAAANRDLEIGQAWRAWSRTKGDSLASVRDFQAERLPQITERDIVAPMLEQGGWQEANPTAQGAQPAQPQPGGVSEGATATNPQTGEKLIFRNGQWGRAQ